MKGNRKMTEAYRKYIRQEEKELTNSLKGFAPEAIALVFDNPKVVE